MAIVCILTEGEVKDIEDLLTRIEDFKEYAIGMQQDDRTERIMARRLLNESRSSLKTAIRTCRKGRIADEHRRPFLPIDILPEARD